MPVAISFERKEQYVFYSMRLPRSLRSLAMTGWVTVYPSLRGHFVPVAISSERKEAVRVLLHGIAALTALARNDSGRRWLARNDRVGNGLIVIARAFMPVAISCMRKGAVRVLLHGIAALTAFARNDIRTIKCVFPH